MRDYEPYYTEDGSIGLYSYADNDVYHSKFGALTEAWEKFIMPSGIENDLCNNREISVLDVCYGIGYNTKALMSFILNKNKKKLTRKNFVSKILNNESIYTNKNTHKTEQILLESNDSICNNNLMPITIDCLDINEELIKLSPLFTTIKTPYEIFSDMVPDIFDCFESYYKCRDVFANIISHFAPRNRRDIKELLDLKFKIMYLEKEYRINGLVNYLIINKLAKIFNKNYLNKEFKKTLRDNKVKRFLNKSQLKYAQFNQFFEYNLSHLPFLSTFLHNIYYDHLSNRYKKIDFKVAEKLFNLNFYISDARKTILTLDKEYDYIFLDAFTYTKAPQLWTIEFIAELHKRIASDGVLLTYSNSAQVRNTLLENNFYVGKIYNSKLNKFIGTIASKDKNKIKYPLTNYEIGLCNTKAGIPYHDPSLCCDKNDILKRRQNEFKQSKLISSSKYIRLRGLNNE